MNPHSKNNHPDAKTSDKVKVTVTINGTTTHTKSHGISRCLCCLPCCMLGLTHRILVAAEDVAAVLVNWRKGRYV